MTDPDRPALRILSTSFAFLALAGACRTTERRPPEEIVSSDIQHGRYVEALEGARRLANERPGDPEAAEMVRNAELAYVLDLGRDKILSGDLEGGLALFEQAQAIDPANPLVQSWILKSRRQLATHWLDVAADHTGPEGLAEAARAFEKALDYEPDNADARRGLAHVLLLQNYRAGMSKTYFEDGLSSFRDLLLQPARREFQVSRHYLENEPAAARAEQVEEMIADERLAHAREFEANGLFSAARNEYRLVLVADPDNADGRDGLDRMDREVRALRTLSEAEMEIRRGELDEAAEVLEQAALLTDMQRDHVTLLLSDIEDRRFERLYADASSLESDYRYLEAVAAYERLLAIAPEYKDAAQRKLVLVEFIQRADEFYAKALAATSDEEAEEFLRRIPVVWPEYKDVAQRIAEIEARKAAKQESEEPPAEEPEDAPEEAPEDAKEPEDGG